MSITLAGRNILITGASSGLGAHFAYITATAGANVALCARRKEKTAREGAKHMINAGSREREHGRIVLISSITARKVSAGIAAYSASKAGVLQMGKVMAREWANKGISVNIVCPGYIETDLNRDWFETDGGKKQIQKFPRRRLLQQTDMDPTILLLCSDQAKGITGSVFTVDDGQSL